MSAFQVGIIAVLFCLNALDGFDVLAISFAAPGISREWSVSPQALGFLISLGLFANAAGSLLVAPFADRIGRRPMIFLSLAAMTAGMLLCSLAGGTATLGAGRLVTGVGVGALVPCISALASEYSNRRYRDFGVIVMAIGFPVGGLVGGQASAWLLQHFDWRSVFVGGGLATGLMMLVPLWWVPESIDYLLTPPPCRLAGARQLDPAAPRTAVRAGAPGRRCGRQRSDRVRSRSPAGTSDDHSDCHSHLCFAQCNALLLPELDSEDRRRSRAVPTSSRFGCCLVQRRRHRRRGDCRLAGDVHPDPLSDNRRGCAAQPHLCGCSLTRPVSCQP